MSKMFDDLKEGLQDAIIEAKSKKKYLKRNTVSYTPLANYKPSDIKKVRSRVGLTQNLFAKYLGVSQKTVEAWESGTNKPSGSSNRLITMLVMDKNLIKKYPFVVLK